MENIHTPALVKVTFPSAPPAPRAMRYAGVEGGGTSWVAAIAVGGA